MSSHAERMAIRLEIRNNIDRLQVELDQFLLQRNGIFGQIFYARWPGAWFAWYPVRLRSNERGRIVWLRFVTRNKFSDTTIYHVAPIKLLTRDQQIALQVGLIAAANALLRNTEASWDREASEQP